MSEVLCPACKVAATLSGPGGVPFCPRCGMEVLAPPGPAPRLRLADPDESPEDELEVLPPTAAVPGALSGRTLGSFRFEAVLGIGSRSIVYAGEQLNLRRAVAIKILRRERVAEAAEVGDFLEAGRTAAGLLHPRITSIYDVVSRGDLHCIVRERLEPAPPAPLVPDELLRLARAIAEALEHAHAQGVLHGALHPGNLLLAGSEWKVADFGHTRFLAVPPEDPERQPYLAPERRAGAEPTPAQDLYAFGALLAHFSAGAPQGNGALARLAGELLAPDPALRPAPAAILLRLRELGPKPLRPTVIAPAAEASAALSRSSILPPSDRRRYHRLRVDGSVQFQERKTSRESAESFLARLGNLSENGAFLASPAPLPIGSFVTLEFVLGERKAPIHVTGIVRWTSRGAEPGMGVQFLEMDEADKRRLRDHMDEKLAAEIVRLVTQTPMHRVLLKTILAHADQKLSIESVLRQTSAGRVLLLRVLSDFERCGLARVAGDSIQCVRPVSERLQSLLGQAAKKGKA